MPNPRRTAMLWEICARLDMTPARAMMLMETQGVIATEEEAEREMKAGGQRNALRLVTERDMRLRSNWTSFTQSH